MPQHPRQHLPLKALLTPHGFDVPLEPRQPCSKCLLRCRRIAPVQPGFERFHEQLGARASRPSGDPIQSSTKLLGQKELMPDLLRLHASLSLSVAGRHFVPLIIGMADCLFDAGSSIATKPTNSHADLGSLSFATEGPTDRP